ncbi:hypothetical protein EIP91_003956 [Steccherinum ochraceum]|uniref:Uncharacterized protein n=1 Tax=Steccherinum ochraceum TaxID=92696 RepID=A0A4V2MXI8_9APHY|nr:hypothetical protein EIP91_003956 [Steccherinum ochraceum]
MEGTQATTTTPASAPAPTDNGPIPMSFPAILRAPGLSDRFAHLRSGLNGVAATAPKKSSSNKRDEKAGKRWVRRKDNARFAGNPHIVAASSRDYQLRPPSTRTTFPEPLPIYLSRNTLVPSAHPGLREPHSANAGRFSMSLKGMRRDLRKAGPRAQVLAGEIEEEVVGWLRRGGVVLDPDANEAAEGMRTPVGTTGGIVEVSRTPLQLVWLIEDDAFARYVVHCCARYHSIVSFSKDTSGQRLTYLLRPNVTRPDNYAATALATPPATESEMSIYEVESDFTDTDLRSDAASIRSSSHNVNNDSDMDDAPPPRSLDLDGLSDIAESAPNSPARSGDEWSVLGDSSDYEGDHDLASSVGSLSLQDSFTFTEHRTPRPLAPGLRQTPLRSHIWEHRNRRSASSPSRSPARRAPPRQFRPRVDPPPVGAKPSERSFYDFLYA